MVSLTQWTWVWATSRRWWRTGKPGVLQSMGSKKVGYDLVTEQLLRFILSQKDIKMLHRNVGFTSKIRTQLIFQGQFAELLYLFLFHYSVQFSHSVMSNSLWPHGLQHTRLPCPSPTSTACSNSCPLSRWCHPIISSSVTPFSSCLQFFPASGSFPMNQFFVPDGQSIGVSTSSSVLAMNIHDYWKNHTWLLEKPLWITLIFTSNLKNNNYTNKFKLCPTPWDPMDCSLPGSSVHGIFQVRILEWVAISFSRGSSWPRDWIWSLLHCRQTLYHWITKQAPK